MMATPRRAGALTSPSPLRFDATAPKPEAEAGTDSRGPQLVSGCVRVTLATATQAGALVIRRGQ